MSNETTANDGNDAETHEKVKKTITYRTGSAPTHLLDLETVEAGDEIGITAPRSDLGLPETDLEPEHHRIRATVDRTRGFDAARDVWATTPSGAELHIYPRRGKVERVDDGERVETHGDVYDVATLQNAGLTYEGDLATDDGAEGVDRGEGVATDGGTEQQIGSESETVEFAEELGLTQATPADPVYLRDTGEHGEVVAVYNCSPYLEATATPAGAADRTTWPVEVPLLVQDIREGNLEVVEPRYVSDAEAVVDRTALATAHDIAFRELRNMRKTAEGGEWTETVAECVETLAEVLDR